jgi:UDP-N-acetylmuramoyl-tripeptide--D-alanyl-D-alanine ligase
MAREGRLVAVLGHMAELGEISVDAHDKLGETIVRVGVDRLITVGEEARLIHTSAVREGQHPDDAVDVQTADEAVAELRRWLRPGDVVLVKGSRVLGLERVAEALR